MQSQTEFNVRICSNESSFDEKDVLEVCVAGQPKGTEKVFFFSLISRLEYHQ